ncbi:hypothetical protein F0562_030025 [Nyssa sinensis]|uniref:RING-type E3 ubiquitin transferase n=1 Tax=Nyssa sinensis TaxID=561372 RepID=A0A5J5AZ71_9ASTE|nr:hypothetical protein F0562_030025 [Nyssa sinensis]
MLSQLFYIKKKVDAIPYISLVMLAIQFLGYSLPMISSAKILFKSMESESYRTKPHDYHGYQMLFDVLDYTKELLLLAALPLTARLFQMVSKSRNELLARGTSKDVHVPSDKKDTYTIDAHILQIWMTKFVDYFVPIQDFFVLPQIIGNLLPRVKPLTKIYTAGLIFTRFFKSFYDLVRDPVVDPYRPLLSEGFILKLNLSYVSKLSNTELKETQGDAFQICDKFFSKSLDA